MFKFVYDFDDNAFNFETSWNDILSYYYNKNDRIMFNSIVKAVYSKIDKNKKENSDMLEKMGIKSAQDIMDLPLQPKIVINDEGKPSVSVGWNIADVSDDVAEEIFGKNFIKNLAEPVAYDDYLNNYFAS